MISEFLPAVFLGLILSFTIGPVFFTILEISVSKGFKAAVFFNLGVVFSEIVFFAIEKDVFFLATRNIGV